MHAVCLGVAKKLTSLWFDPKYSSFPWTLSDKIAKVDSDLRAVKPPRDIKRLPRSLKERQHWKGKDFFLSFSLFPSFLSFFPFNFSSSIRISILAPLFCPRPLGIPFPPPVSRPPPSLGLCPSHPALGSHYRKRCVPGREKLEHLLSRFRTDLRSIPFIIIFPPYPFIC